MLLQVISLLTAEQKRALDNAGISRQLVSDWRKERRLPTEPQAVILAGIAGANVAELQADIAMSRATPEQRPLVAAVLKKALAGVVATLCFGQSAVVPPVATHGERATMYKPERRKWVREDGETAH